MFPEARIEAISAVIVAVYLISLVALEVRYRAINRTTLKVSRVSANAGVTMSARPTTSPIPQ